MEEKDKIVLFELGPDIREGLNIAAIFPYLVKHSLTTSEERESLLNSCTTTIDKKNNLLYLWLPHKGNDSLNRFMEALKDSIEEEPTHETLLCKIQAKRTEADDHSKFDSGIEAAGRQYSPIKTSSDASHYSSRSKSPDRNLPKLSPDDDDDDTGQWESLSNGSESEADILQDSLQKQYSNVMGPKGVAKIADKIAVGEFRLFCFSITRTAEDYSRMGSECCKSNDVWCRVSMNCNLCYFAPLESICQHFSSCSDELKLIKEYKNTLSNGVYEPILKKTKPNEGYQSITKPKELFASCIVTIANSLDERIADKKIRLEDMKSYFCTLKKSSVDHEQELLITNRNMQDNINKAKDVYFLLFAISPCWDCINFLFLEEHVVKQFGGDEERCEIAGYKRCLKNRWLTRSVKECPDMTPELTCFEHYNEVICKINADWDTTKIRQVLRLRKVIASVYNVDLSVVKLHKVTKGSIIVYFALPSSCITELSDEKVLLLAKHNFLALTVCDKAGKINPTFSYDITEKFATLDKAFQTPTNSLSNNELCSDVLLVEKEIKDSSTLMLSHDEPKILFKHLASYYIVLQTFTTSSKLNIYHNASNYTDGKGLIHSRTLYGIDVQMKSNKEPCILEVTHHNSVLTISFETQAEAQQWFIALKRIIGWFHLHLKIFPPNVCIPEDLVVQVEGDSLAFWSVVDDSKCMEWKLSDLNSVYLKNALYICVKNSSNALLKEDMYVFEGQQLEKLYDLLEEYKSALSNNSEYENSLTDSHSEQEDRRQNIVHVPAHHAYSSLQKVHKRDKQLKRTPSSSSSEEIDSLNNFSTNDYDILNEILNAESASTVYHAFSWKVKEEIQLQDKSIQLIKTSWYDVVSKYILNRGYRIIVTMADQQTRILAQERNNQEGKKQIQSRWKIIVQAVKKAYTIFKPPPCTKEIGNFQTDSVVVQTSDVHDFTMPHFQNVYYGTTNPSSKTVQGFLQTGMAQCTIPPEQLKEMYSNLSKNKFWLKLWPSSALDASINVSYLNEVEHHQFKETLDEPTSYSTNSDILLYIPRSSKSFTEKLVQTSQLAVDLGFSGKVVVFDWRAENCIANIDQVTEKVKPQLLQFIRMLYLHSTKVHIVAVYDAALLVMKLMSSAEMDFSLGQVIFTRLANLSSSIFDDLQKLADTDKCFPCHADNVTIYHHPKSCSKSLLPIRSLTYGSSGEIFSKKVVLEPPPFVKNVDIICLGRHPHGSVMKNREYAVNKIVIEDMSEIICFERSTIDRSSRIKFQCGCREPQPLISRSRLTCTLCNCTCYFVLGCVIGLGNFTPSLLEEMQQSMLQKQERDIKKCSSVSNYIRT